MKNSILILYTILSFTSVFSQSDRTMFYGKILADSLSTENVHIVNTTSQKGTTSNAYGEFEMPVKANDTLLFSAIQFENKMIIISTKQIKSQKLIITLRALINQLDEVALKTHDLTGMLHNDIENTTLEHYVDEFTLDLPNAGKGPVTEVDFINRKINFYAKGGTITQLYGLLSGATKKLEKLKKLETEKMMLDKIRKLITDPYYIEILKIHKDDISLFIEYCKPKGIIRLYKQNKKMRVIDILIKESRNYNE